MGEISFCADKVNLTGSVRQSRRPAVSAGHRRKEAENEGGVGDDPSEALPTHHERALGSRSTETEERLFLTFRGGLHCVRVAGPDRVWMSGTSTIEVVRRGRDQ